MMATPQQNSITTSSARKDVFPNDMKMYETLLAALHEVSCSNPMNAEAFMAGVWNPVERQSLFQWLKVTLEGSDIPLSVFFKTTQMFDRFLENDAMEQLNLPKKSSTATISTLASSPKTPEAMQGGGMLETRSCMDTIHLNCIHQLSKENNPQGTANALFTRSWSRVQTQRALVLACCSLVMKLDFRKHYSKHYESLMQQATGSLFGPNVPSATSGSSQSQKHGGNQFHPPVSVAIPPGHQMYRDCDAGGSGPSTRAITTDTNSSLLSHSDSLNGYGLIGFQEYGVPQSKSERDWHDAQEQPIQYVVALTTPKQFIQSLEWPVVKTLRFKLSVPCVIDFLDYFDMHVGIRSRKAYAVDVILYHPELLYSNKLTAISLAVWFLSHKNQEHVHAILQKMQQFDSFASSKKLEERRRLQRELQSDNHSTGNILADNAISTADLRRLVTQLREAFKSSSNAAASATSGVHSSPTNNAPVQHPPHVPTQQNQQQQHHVLQSENTASTSSYQRGPYHQNDMQQQHHHNHSNMHNNHGHGQHNNHVQHNGHSEYNNHNNHGHNNHVHSQQNNGHGQSNNVAHLHREHMQHEPMHIVTDDQHQHGDNNIVYHHGYYPEEQFHTSSSSSSASFANSMQPTNSSMSQQNSHGSVMQPSSNRMRCYEDTMSTMAGTASMNSVQNSMNSCMSSYDSYAAIEESMNSSCDRVLGNNMNAGNVMQDDYRDHGRYMTTKENKPNRGQGGYNGFNRKGGRKGQQQNMYNYNGVVP